MKPKPTKPGEYRYIRPMPGWLIVEHVLTQRSNTIILLKDRMGTRGGSVHPGEGDVQAEDAGHGWANLGRILATNPGNRDVYHNDQLIIYRQKQNHQGMGLTDCAQLAQFFRHDLDFAFVIPIHAVIGGVGRLPLPGELG